MSRTRKLEAPFEVRVSPRVNLFVDERRLINGNDVGRDHIYLEPPDAFGDGDRLRGIGQRGPIGL